MENDFPKRRKIDVHMFLSGKIIFDKTGDITKIIQKAKEYKNKKFPKPKEYQIQLSRYSLWDM